MIYFYSFLFCGFVCLVGQLILDNTKLTAGHITAIFVVIGSALDTFHIYDDIIKMFGAGAMVPITSFGHSLTHGAIDAALDIGFIGLFTGMFEFCAAGITGAIVFTFILSIFLKAKN